jgi:hypothetical protein
MEGLRVKEKGRVSDKYLPALPVIYIPRGPSAFNPPPEPYT